MPNWKKVEMSPVWNGRDEDKKLIIKPGDSIEGKLLDVTTDVGPNHSTLYTIKTSTGAISVWGSTVLDVRMKNLTVGEDVKIEYLGTEKSAKVKGREYHVYEVYHDDKGADIPVIEEDDIKPEDIPF